MKKMLFISMLTCFLSCTGVQASIANSTSSSSQFDQIATNLSINEGQIKEIKAFKDKNNAAAGFTFHAGQNYKYYYATQKLEEI